MGGIRRHNRNNIEKYTSTDRKVHKVLTSSSLPTCPRLLHTLNREAIIETYIPSSNRSFVEDFPSARKDQHTGRPHAHTRRDSISGEAPSSSS